MIWHIVFDDLPPVQVEAPNEQQARYAIGRYLDVLQIDPIPYRCGPFRPMLRTDGRRVDVLATDNSGEYVGMA